MGDRDAASFAPAPRRRVASRWLQRLAEMVGVAIPYLIPIERGLRDPRDEILHQAAGALRISAKVLYRQAGMLDRCQRGEAETAIVSDAAITARQRDVLIEIYESFRRQSSGGATADGVRSRSTERASSGGGGHRDLEDGHEGLTEGRSRQGGRGRRRRIARRGVEAGELQVSHGRTAGTARERRDAASRDAARAGGHARGRRLAAAGRVAFLGAGDAVATPGARVDRAGGRARTARQDRRR